MVIQVKEVWAEVVNPLPFSFAVDFSEMEFFGRRLFPLPGLFAGQVEYRAELLSLAGELSLTMETACDSCGRPVSKTVKLPVFQTLTLEESAAEQNDELLFCENGKLDLLDVASDALVLHTEMRILCQEDCKGVCFGCGVNLNEGPCRCEKEIDPRLEALRSLL